MFNKQQHSLIALAVLFALVVIGLTVGGLLQERRRVLAVTEKQAEAAALFTAAYTGRTYDVAADVLDDAVAYMREARPSREALRQFLAQRTARTGLAESVVVTDAAGRLVLSSEHPNAPPVEFGDRPWFRAHAAGEELHLGPVLRSRVSDDVLWTLSRRIEDADGRFAGAVAVGARAIGVQPAGRRRPEEPQVTVWIRDGRMLAATFLNFDADGRAIAPSPPTDGLSGAPRVSAEGPRITGSSPVPGWPLVTVVAYDKSGVLAPWRREAATGGLVVLAALLGGAVLVSLGARSAGREERARVKLTLAVQEAKGALAQRDLLLKEVHHRMKNSLMMTASLLSLQARSFQDPRVRAAFDQTRSRLSSISLVHEALYAGDGAEVELAQYLKRLLHEIAYAHGADARRIALSVDIEPMRLPAERATLVGLIVSEVVSNAFKHAFPDDAGSIRVKASRRPGGAAEICVADDGVGYGVPGADSHGLGAKLIRVLAEQLGGRISFTNEQGATFRLSFSQEQARPSAERARAAAL